MPRFQQLLDQASAGLSPVLRQRVARHLLAQIVCLGTHSITALLCASGRLEQDWSADYRMYSRQRVDPESLFGSVRQDLFGRLGDQDQPAVVALDDTRIRKSGCKVSGAKYTRDPLGPAFHVNFIWAQRYLQLSMASGQDANARMVPVGWRHAPLPRKPSSKASAEEHERYRVAAKQQSLGVVACRELKRLRDWMDAQGHAARLLCGVVDGGYTNKTVLRGLPERTVLIGRIRADAKLCFLPDAVDHPTGRPRVYGLPAPTPEQLRQDESVPWQQIPVWIGGQCRQVRIKTLGPLCWRAAGANHTLQLVVLAPLCYHLTPAGERYYRKPAYIISTDEAASPQQIVQRYVSRWDIEVNFRDEKTLLGVGEAQVRHERAVETVTGTAVAAYAMLLAAAGKLHPAQQLWLPKPRWQRRACSRVTTRQLIQQMRLELWGEAMSAISPAGCPSADLDQPRATFSDFVSTKPLSQDQRNGLHNPFHALFHASRYS